MRNILKIIGLVLYDLFNSTFATIFYKISLGVIICWALFIPSTVLLDKGLSKVPVIKYIYMNDAGEYKPIGQYTLENGDIKKYSYKKQFLLSIENPLYFIAFSLGGLLFIIMCLTPLIMLLVLFIVLGVIILAVRNIWDFVHDLPTNFKIYKQNLLGRLNDKTS